jgi:hexosaminidase
MYYLFSLSFPNMKKTMITLVAVLHMATWVYGQSAAEINIIPQPVEIRSEPGAYTFHKNIIIEAPVDNTLIKAMAGQLKERLATATGSEILVTRMSAATIADIRLVLNKAADTAIGKEGYTLDVTPANGLTIKANEPAGLFYGIQTLLQLLPPAIESSMAVDNIAWKVPNVHIKDYPRFGWRGVMLDVARHFFTKQQVKKFIDEMVTFKFNMLHLHLSDDQGWRIEIKSLPELTKIGAWRAERTGRWGEFTKPTPEEPKNYGGFYTQDDIRELLQYAAERNVTIMPEIDIPGHSLAMIASYPDLVCTPGTYQVNAGERLMIWEKGTFYGLLDNNLCPANEKVYELLDKVFGEIALLFPFQYIHMGGDECYKGFWKKSEACQQLMQREGLKNEHELQSYFVKRVEKIIQSKGKKMMGWDEILQGGLAPDATVMSWQGMKGGIEAAHQGHQVVMSPNDYAYVDLYQGDPIAEPVTYSMLRLSKCYQFDPLPAGIDPKYILGGQCNLWSERLYTVRHQQYMLWPRGLAIAESVWSQPGQKNWTRFIEKVENQFTRFDAAEINYSRSMYDPIFKAVKNSAGELEINLSTEIEGLAIFYSFDETIPDKFYPAYSKPLTVPKDAANLRVITYRNGKPVGKQIMMPVNELKKRAGIKVEVKTPA